MGTDVLISFYKPLNNGAEITEYRVEIQKHDSNYSTSDECDETLTESASN